MLLANNSHTYTLYKMGNSAAYIANQPAERQHLLTGIHQLIMEHDTTVTPAIEPMMGVEMIIYKAKGMMKYGLAGVKNYMSLHVLPIYAAPALHAKYKALLPHANFQKGCINFSNAEEMPLEIVQQLITDCANIDLVKIREEQLAERKLKRAKK